MTSWRHVRQQSAYLHRSHSADEVIERLFKMNYLVVNLEPTDVSVSGRPTLLIAHLLGQEHTQPICTVAELGEGVA